jgi:hypothetical protein
MVVERRKANKTVFGKAILFELKYGIIAIFGGFYILRAIIRLNAYQNFE